MVKIILLSILGLFVLLLLLRITLWVTVRDGEAALSAGTLCFRFRVYPRPKKATKPKKAKKKKPKAAKKTAKADGKHPTHKKEPLSEQIQTVLDFLEPLPKPVKRLIRGVRITQVSLFIRVAEEDAAATAIGFGKTCAAVHSALAVLRNIFTIQVKTIRIEPDFLSGTPAYEGSCKMKLPVYTAAAALAGYLWAYLKKALAKQKAAQQIQPSGHGGKL